MKDFPSAADDRSEGLHRDLTTLIMPRRRALGLIASAGSAALIGCSRAPAAAAPSGGACPLPGTETNGPFPADGSNSANGSLANVLIESGVVREDIRTSFAGLSGTADGVPVRLDISLVNANAACAPLPGAAIYIWQCDAEGRYSIYELPEQNYLRGVAVADAAGKATFTTVFPGCYPGRYPHIHFEVYASLDAATDFANRRLVSQFILPEPLCADVYGSAPLYSASVRHFSRMKVATDGVFRDNTPAEIAVQTLKMTGDAANGFAATATVGVAA